MPLLSKRAEKLCARQDLSAIVARTADHLGFIEEPVTAGAPLLLDTSVYIHQLKNKTPRVLDSLVSLRQVNHSVVAIQELLHAVGALDPADARTKANVGAIRALLDAIPLHRLFTPAADVMMDAAVLAGILCRLKGYAKDRRMRALNDCTVFLQARALGFVVVTANVADFDILLQLVRDGRAFFYRAI